MLELNSVAFMQTSQNFCHHAGSNRGPSVCEANVITTTPCDMLLTASRPFQMQDLNSVAFMQIFQHILILSFLTKYLSPWSRTADFLHVKHIWQSLILHLDAIISTETSPLHMLELNSVAFMQSVQNIHKLSLLRKTFVTTRARTADFLHVKNFWQSLILHHGEFVSTATRPLQVLELNCCVHTKRSTYPYTFTSSQNFCSRGLEPRTFCVWGRSDNHYTMVTCFQQHQDRSKCRI